MSYLSETILLHYVHDCYDVKMHSVIRYHCSTMVQVQWFTYVDVVSRCSMVRELSKNLSPLVGSNHDARGDCRAPSTRTLVIFNVLPSTLSLHTVDR